MNTLTIDNASSQIRRRFDGRNIIPWRVFEAKPRLYVHPSGETVLDNFFVGRRNRPTDLYRQLLPEMLAAHGLPADTKASWSRKAGCSCGCSPGFILTLPKGCTYEQTHSDYWVDVSADTLAVAAVGAANADAAVEAGYYADKRSGRGPSGKLRNFRQMTDVKLRRTLREIEAAGDDQVALDAVNAEVMRRFKNA